MNLKETRQMLEYLHYLICAERTGPPAELAVTLNVSERTVKRYIADLRDMGADIQYCRYRNTYYYATPVTLRFGFEPLSESESNLLKSGGRGDNVLIICNILPSGGRATTLQSSWGRLCSGRRVAC